jgi:hypothetical protein
MDQVRTDGDHAGVVVGGGRCDRRGVFQLSVDDNREQTSVII